MTVRHIESLIRISETLAKIRNDPIVCVNYVPFPVRLLKSNKIIE